jgi:hypothetical protein
MEADMRKMFLFLPIIALALFAFGSFTLAGQDKEHGGRPLTATLTGATEVPGPGDTDGSGTASITLNPGQGQVCYELTVKDIKTATAAHIHAGAAGVAGPVKVDLKGAAEGTWKGCVDADKELVKDIMQNPGNYYVNVHNTDFPNGAIRGQLTK